MALGSIINKQSIEKARQKARKKAEEAEMKRKRMKERKQITLQKAAELIWHAAPLSSLSLSVPLSLCLPLVVKSMLQNVKQLSLLAL